MDPDQVVGDDEDDEFGEDEEEEEDEEDEVRRPLTNPNYLLIHADEDQQDQLIQSRMRRHLDILEEVGSNYGQFNEDLQIRSNRYKVINTFCLCS